jgi:uncharacterized protein (DUF488 family)
VSALFTIGHSTRPFEALVGLLQHHRIDLLADVRTVPASRRMPHFARASLERSLPAHGIEYRHLPALGGLRKPRQDSTNTGWRNVSFRGYADYMGQDAFWQGLAELAALSSGRRVAVMCAEAVPWRCHRSLLSDALTVRGHEVRHITALSDPTPHVLTPFARLQDGRIRYPPPDTLPL